MTATWNSEPLFKVFAYCDMAEEAMVDDESTVAAAVPDEDVLVEFYPPARFGQRQAARSIAVKRDAVHSPVCHPNWPGWLESGAKRQAPIHWTPGLPLFLAA